MADLASIQQKIIAFRNERDWAQFHDPKNLAEALVISMRNMQQQNFPPKATVTYFKHPDQNHNSFVTKIHFEVDKCV